MANTPIKNPPPVQGEGDEWQGAVINTPPEDYSNIRVKASEIGRNGLHIIGGKILEECNEELRWPSSIFTWKEMSKDGTIAPALSYFETWISETPSSFVAPAGYEEKLKKDVDFFNSLKDDMEHSWLAFIKQCISFHRYGFAAHEIVPRRRLKRKGSRFNDGKWGLRKLPLIAQDTVFAWDYDEQYHRDLVGMKQRVGRQTNWNDTNPLPYIFINNVLVNYVEIPRDNFLLFRNNPLKNNPEGTSILAGAWRAWKYKVAYEKVESEGAAQEILGFKVLYIPPEYMTADASDSKKLIFEQYKQMLANASVGKNSGFLLPQVVDAAGHKQFEFDILSQKGTRSYNVSEIIARYQAEILTSLFADFLTLGQAGGGSFALSESKSAMTSMIKRSKQREIEDVINHELIPKIYAWNNMDDSVMVQFKFEEEFDANTVDVATKGLQRTAAVGLVAKTPKNINAIAQLLGLPDRVDENMSQDELNKLLTPNTSGSSEGMAQGLPSGTGNATGGGDTSVKNSENK